MSDPGLFDTDADSDDTAPPLPEGFGLPVEAEDDDEDSWDALLGETADFSLMFPPNADYAGIVRQVEYRRNRVTEGKNAGKVSKGWMVNLQVDMPGSDYDKSFQNTYIWLGHDDGFAPFGLQMLCNFLTATLHEDYSEKAIDMRSFGPERRTDRNGKRIMVMTRFDDLPVVFTLNTAPEVDPRTKASVKRTKVTEFKPSLEFDPDRDTPDF